MESESTRRPEPPSGDSRSQPFLVVLLNEDKYFVTLALVNKIINPLEIFPLPDTPPYILGVANFTGEIVPIVDLKKVLKIPPSGLAGQKKFLICKYRDLKVGFLVDNVLDAWDVDAGEFQTDTNRVLENDYIQAEYIHKGEVIGVIDVAALITDHQAR